ncbi:MULTISPECIES: HD-GYP domain-containing protein [unclassified Carboxydocella]|uniref:HD-GYP domain-containing protein n=1 Tax=unclassified Carboxydocella TaxID=2685367 RepID=UPI0009AE88F7|nr:MULTISPECIES: HD-GYP domain-containing protein [unclassified Carboxydocella]GAW29683.1 hypothetical protein ULO1_22530 [Carboxydocella sp. ULO1]GAW31425.1 hypothetical protein JDF658_11900 [Carboxydocella sp. JDF658]
MKRILIYDAKPGMILARPVYSRDGVLLIKAGKKLTEKLIKSLFDYAIPTVYIVQPKPWEEINIQTAYEKVKELPDVISFETRLEAEKLVAEFMSDIKAGQLFNVKKARAVINEMIAQIISYPKVLTKLSDIRILDDYTFAHSVNVCTLAIAVGHVMGLEKSALYELAMGALLHDVGKCFIPESILNKPGPLTNEEMKIVRTHTERGFQILRMHPEISTLAANVARQHHERVNGTGYPQGLSEKQIHIFAKIVAVVDAYDALTADRVYKNMVLPYEAIEVLIASSYHSYDAEIVKAFVQNLAIYPIGSIVELLDGRLATVININRGIPYRPVVKIISDQYGNTVLRGEIIDLMKEPTVFVKKVLQFKNVELI